MSLQIVYLARHGETAWTLSGQHTGLTDLPLTEHGEQNAIHLGERLKGLAFAKVLTSPLQRARRTCELAGFGAVAEIDPDLVEWNYGEYEGLTSAQVQSSDRTGSSFATDVPAARQSRRLAPVPIGSLRGCAEFKGTCCCFPADTSCGCWRRDGWGWMLQPDSISC